MSLLIKSVWIYLFACLNFGVAAIADEEEANSNYVGYIELKPFVTNFDGGEQLRFLKAEVTIQVDQEVAHHYINAHKPQIRNDLLFLFAEQAEVDVKGVAAQGILAGKALDVVQKAMIAETGQPQASDLFFTSFVIQ